MKRLEGVVVNIPYATAHARRVAWPCNAKPCGITRYVIGWQAWRYELDDAECRVKYLKDTEPIKDQP